MFVNFFTNFSSTFKEINMPVNLSTSTWRWNDPTTLNLINSFSCNRCSQHPVHVTKEKKTKKRGFKLIKADDARRASSQRYRYLAFSNTMQVYTPPFCFATPRFLLSFYAFAIFPLILYKVGLKNGKEGSKEERVWNILFGSSVILSDMNQTLFDASTPRWHDALFLGSFRSKTSPIADKSSRRLELWDGRYYDLVDEEKISFHFEFLIRFLQNGILYTDEKDILV